jgi:hypothetical protein
MWAGSGIVLTGAQLATHGVQLPRQHPESGILLHLTVHLPVHLPVHLAGAISSRT